MVKRFLLKHLPDPVLLALKKRHYTRYLKRLPVDEHKEFDVVKALVDVGDRTVDIGANTGVYTKFLADLVGRDGIVYSFEPV
jgi:predicted methyltransferase